MLWIPYRDGWVALGTKVRPDLPAEAWKTWLTIERTKMLSALLGD
jgi:hypothetical protein